MATVEGLLNKVGGIFEQVAGVFEGACCGAPAFVGEGEVGSVSGVESEVLFWWVCGGEWGDWVGWGGVVDEVHGLWGGEGWAQ